jgi:hypothetical protein
MDIAARFDHPGRSAWLGLMVLGFVFCWPVGLAALAFLIGSGRMSCWSHEGARYWRERVMERYAERHGPGRHRRGGCGYGTSGNRAFDAYRTETLRRLEEEEREFREFLDRLRFAKDKVEFDEFLAQRRNRPESPAPEAPQN